MTTDRTCLDAETVAAWMDGGLDPAAQAAAEAHASTCERCQALLATVVRTEPVAHRHEAPGTSRFWQWWLAPLAATAAAITIWLVVPQELMQPERRPTPITEMAVEAGKPQAPPAAEPAASNTAPPANNTAPAQGNAARLQDATAQKLPTRPQAESAKALAEPPARDAAPPAENTARRNVPADADAARDRNAFAKEVEKPAAVGGLRADAQGAKREEAPRATEMRQAAEAPAAAAPAPPAAERFREPQAPPPAAPAIGALTKQATAPAVVQIVSPDPNSRWRAMRGTIERSEDGGRIWLPVRLNAGEQVLAGASPARLVCWLVGRGGLVLLGTDGTNFTRLPFPAVVDLVSVSSPEPRIAEVTAADGRVFRTEDGGRNWRNP